MDMRALKWGTADGGGETAAPLATVLPSAAANDVMRQAVSSGASLIEVGQSAAGPTMLDLGRMLATRLLVQAGSGGGKSWLLRRLIEQAYGKVRMIVFDPEGELVTLAEKFDFTVCAPDSEVAPIRPTTGAEAARAIYLSGRSAIISLSEFEGLEEMQQFVADFCRELLRMPPETWHHVVLVFDEAQLFAPQLDKAVSKKPLIDLSRRGRKRGMCPVIASQRLSELSKGVASHLENKLIGLTTLDLDIARAAEMLGMRAPAASQVLRRLPGGHFIAFGPALGYDLSEVKVGPVLTRHGFLQPFTGLAAEPSLSHDALAKMLRDLAGPADTDQPAAQQARRTSSARRGARADVGPFDDVDAGTSGREIRLTRSFDAADAILDGIDLDDIAEAHGVSDQAVRNWLRQALDGINLRRLGIRGRRLRVDELRSHAETLKPALARNRTKLLKQARRAAMRRKPCPIAA